MDLRFKNRRAMVTVELAVTLVLIVVALFVTLGLFNNNLRDMVANSNFKNLFNGNGSRTFFSFFNKDYKNAQVYVQIMGEQGLQILRKKANNGVVSAIASLPANGAPIQSTASYSTISYLSQIIMVIMGNQIICNTMTTPSIAECSDPGMPGAKYNIEVTETSIVVRPVGNSASKSFTLTVDHSATDVAPNATSSKITAAKNASGLSTKDKFKFISNLSNDNSSNSQALVKTIGYFNSVVSRGGSYATLDTTDAKVSNMLKQISTNMDTANDKCMHDSWCVAALFNGGQCTSTDGCGKDADVVNDGDLENFNTHYGLVTETIAGYAAQANCIAYPQTQGCTQAPGGAAYLPLDPKVLPTYSANGHPTAIPDVVAYNSTPDMIALASYKNGVAITAGISDMFVMNPLGDTSNMMARYACRATTTGSCPAGEYMASTNCCMPNGVDANGDPISTPIGECPVDSYYNSTSGTCKTCPLSYTDGGDGDTCFCSNKGTFNVGTGACLPPADDGTGTTSCQNGWYNSGNGVCTICPFGLPGNGGKCTCPTGSSFYIMPDGYGTCQCSNGGVFDGATLTCSTTTVNPATIAANICKTGIASRCDALMIEVLTTVNGNTKTVNLMTSYIASPLNDSRLSAVTSARATYLQDRIKILLLYNQMMDAIWNDPHAITNDMQEDNYSNPKSCDLLKKDLIDFANASGIISMAAEVSTNPARRCIPAVK